ncbi:nuclease-related domain-containing protein [Sporosarcina sp. Te-1]|uniref:nuclease-related domain-containing protein n=1 Tax=Sporosarcina sp. Te-1 TaxID=2818390 RepID=UPI001A9CF6AD|nr:nuclease-related domain-containing protein [Sporosarcina sp. Te-1]QTD40497.1 NERD domain-containing protein [Sporosarcina sp. Te-1]
MLEGLEAAIQRLPAYHEALPAVVAKQAAVQAGFGGEQELDKVFETYKFPMKYSLFHDISLQSSTHFQVDTLFLTPWFAVLFEVKNISGELLVTQNPPQLIRTSGSGQVTSFKSPVAQLASNCELFKDWLHSRRMSLPVYGAVVLAYVKQRVELSDIDTPFLFPSTVPQFIRSLPKGKIPLLDSYEFEQLSADLCHSHQAYNPAPICKTYDISHHAIQRGVICPACGSIGMKWHFKGWCCKSCQETSRTAHHQAIRDWFLLFGGGMRNRDCREFLGVERQQTAHRLLASMPLRKEGRNRNRTYTLIWNEDSKHT